MNRSEEEELVKSEKEWGDNFATTLKLFLAWVICTSFLALLIIIYGILLAVRYLRGLL